MDGDAGGHASSAADLRRVQKLKAETDRLRALLSAKDDLLQAAAEEKARLESTIEIQESQLGEMSDTIKEKDNASGVVHDELKASEEEFELLTDALGEKDKLLSKKNSKIMDLEQALAEAKGIVELKSDQLAKASREVAMSEQLRKSELAKAKKKASVETVDECLSARSWSENQLVALRDDALSVKDSQIQLINENNASLRENVEHLEAEVERMQVDMVAKDRTISKLRAELEDCQAEIVDLTRAAQVKEGADVAMEVATKQNVQLLQLLQQTETLAKELEEKNASLEDELSESKAKHKAAVARAAEFEVSATTERHTAVELKRELLSVRSNWEVEERSLRQRLDQLETTSTATISELREEVRERREKHYEMMANLQSAESKARDAEDRAFTHTTEADDAKSMLRELDVRLIEQRRWAETAAEKHANELAAIQGELKRTEKTVANLQAERKALTAQLHEMSGTVIKAVDKQQGAMEQALELKSTADERAEQLETLKKRMVMEGNLQGKRRMKVELEQRTLVTQLEAMRDENLRLARATNANFDAQTEQANKLAERCAALEQQLEQANEAQQSRLERLLAYVQSGDCFIRDRKRPSSGNVDQGLRTLHLEDCFLGCTLFQSQKAALAAVVRLGKLLAHMLSNTREEGPIAVNLARNAISDLHVHKALTKVVATGCPAASVMIDLRGNNLSADGIRALVLALGKNPKVKSVFAHRDGTIQGSRGADILYTIIVRENKALETCHDDLELIASHPTTTSAYDELSLEGSLPFDFDAGNQDAPRSSSSSLSSFSKHIPLIEDDDDSSTIVSSNILSSPEGMVQLPQLSLTPRSNNSSCK